MKMVMIFVVLALVILGGYLVVANWQKSDSSQDYSKEIQSGDIKGYWAKYLGVDWDAPIYVYFNEPDAEGHITNSNSVFSGEFHPDGYLGFNHCAQSLDVISWEKVY